MNITKRKSSYRIRVYYGKDDNGKPLFVTQSIRFDDPRFEGMTERKRDKAVEAIGFDYEQEVKVHSTLSSISFRVFAEKWFRNYADIQLASTTYERNENFKERTYTVLGDMRMDKIKTIHVQDFINSLTKPGANKVDPDKGLSSKTIKHYLSFISGIFEYAIRIEMLSKNPCSNVILPPSDQTEKKIYTKEQAERFVDLLFSEAPLKYQLFATLAFVCGLRRSEIVGLKYKDFELSLQRVKIERAANYSRKRKEMYIGKTKTKKSARYVHLPEIIILIFEKYKEQEIARKNFMGIEHSDEDFLFCDETYTKIMYNGLPYNYLKKMCERNGLEYYGIHALRHFSASAMTASGTDIKTVSKVLGHSAPDITLSTYVHSFSESLIRATDSVAKMLDLTERFMKAT